MPTQLDLPVAFDTKRLDQKFHAALARATASLSPASCLLAFFDWAMHLAYAPGKRIQLVDKAIRKSVRFTNYACRHSGNAALPEPCIEPYVGVYRRAGRR